MKTLIYYMLAWVVFPGILLGEEIKLDRDLKQPEWKEVLANPEHPALKLKALLDQGKLREFYEEADRFLDKLRKSDLINPSEEEMKSQLWVFYYIAAAPFVSLESPEDVDWCFRTSELDYKSKLSAFMQIHPPCAPLKVEEIFYELHSLYYAKILHDFRQERDPEFLEKTKKLEERLTQMRSENSPIEVYNMSGFINTWTSRKNAAARRSKLYEKVFIRKMVIYYPGKASEARKYIKLAGYEEKEIDDLIDRTVGRNEKTEFLYKGRAKLPTRKEMK